MIDTVHFISGLPRSGSTLLCALLKQNPRFSAGMTSPVASLLSALQQKMSGANEFSLFFDDGRRRRILQSVFDGYYANVPAGSVLFDTNRTWTARAPLLDTLYPKARIVCCVRDVGWIIDSVERMLRKNPLQLSRIFSYQPGSSVYSRVETLMNSDGGLIGLAWSGLREAWFGDHAKKLIVIDYDMLTRYPGPIMTKLYAELGEPAFDHDFQNVVYDEPDYDAHLGMPGLHKVRQAVSFEKRDSILPPDILAKYANLSFWRNPDMNPKGVSILRP